MTVFRFVPEKLMLEDPRLMLQSSAESRWIREADLFANGIINERHAAGQFRPKFPASTARSELA